MSASRTSAHLVERAAELIGHPGAAAPGVTLPRPLPHADPRPAEPASPPRRAEPAAEPVSLEALRNAGLIAPDGAVRSRVAEEIAVIQHQMLRTVQEGPRAAAAQGRIVVVTSALRGEGKSFAALNLAAATAAGGLSTVLVDVDGRNGGCSHALGLAGGAGLRQLAGDPTLRPAALLRPTALPRLSVLPYGAASGTEGALSGSALAGAVLRLAADLPRHVVVIDTPPSLSTSEASTLASVAGQVILVVNAERTQRSEVEAALDLLEACPALQLMLNRVLFSTADTFGAHGDYGAPDAG